LSLPLPREHYGMGLLWGILKLVTLVFGVIIAVLVVVDGTLLANLFRKHRGGDSPPPAVQ
jgi:uncharacterized membrane protein